MKNQATEEQKSLWQKFLNFKAKKEEEEAELEGLYQHFKEEIEDMKKNKALKDCNFGILLQKVLYKSFAEAKMNTKR